MRSWESIPGAFFSGNPRQNWKITLTKEVTNGIIMVSFL